MDKFDLDELLKELAEVEAARLVKEVGNALQALADGPGLMVYEFEGEYYDTGSRLGFVAANVAYSLDEGDELRNILREMIT